MSQPTGSLVPGVPFSEDHADFAHIDTQHAILKVQLDDLDHIASKGKSRADVVSDSDLAFQLYKLQLESGLSRLSDHRIAQSIAQAVVQDGMLILEHQAEEDLADQDRQYALCLSGQSDGSQSHPQGLKVQAQNARAKSKQEKLENSAFTNENQATSSEDAVDPDETLESSAWAAKRVKKTAVERPCVACQEAKNLFGLKKLRCGDEYCQSCLEELIRTALTDEAYFPPRCHRQNVDVIGLRSFIDKELMLEYEEKRVELESTNRLYCHVQTCSAFIPPQSIAIDVGRCPKCSASTCTICKGATHTGDCPQDTALQQVLETASQQGWKRCSACDRLIELSTGCNHITYKPSTSLRGLWELMTPMQMLMRCEFLLHLRPTVEDVWMCAMGRSSAASTCQSDQRPPPSSCSAPGRADRRKPT